MAQPKWITPAGDLGIITNEEYYEYSFNAYDLTGGGLTYKLISGILPVGLRITTDGKIQGSPAIELQGNNLVEYKFTVRIENSDNQISDRSFKISVNDNSPPVIIPKPIDLGRYLDGTHIDVNLVAIDNTPNANLVWSVLSGSLPTGLTLTKTGRLHGYIEPVISTSSNSIPGWDNTSWDVETSLIDLPWDFTPFIISKKYSFTIQVFDGVYSDISTYNVTIVPREDFLISKNSNSTVDELSLTADQTSLTLGYDFDTDQIEVIPLTASESDRHNPIIVTTQEELIPTRQKNYFLFQFKAKDLDNDVLNYAITALDNSSFDQINIGFDTTKYSQTELSMPGHDLVLDTYTGWMFGRLPYQSVNQKDYEFELSVYKRDYPEYITKKIFKLSIIGDINDTINWVTDSDLGTIENGDISELLIKAQSNTKRKLYYTLTVNESQRLPQGLQLNSDGLIYGRVSFETFVLDSNNTTLDYNSTKFDSVYTFNVTASDVTNTVSSSKTFKIKVVPRNTTPYENLYLKAFMPKSQRLKFLDIINNTSLFPPELIYRNSDPYYGLPKELKFLFLAGLTPSDMTTYVNSVVKNHYNKKLILGDVKTAIALDEQFKIKYEVVYVEVIDPASNRTGGNAKDSITQPEYDQIIYTNGLGNMKDEILSNITYANKGALPDWMTSNQLDSNNNILPSLGLKHAVVLAYTIPGGSSKIKYNLTKQSNVTFNGFDFTVDRYLLDNNYSSNFDTTTSKYIRSRETTFDEFFGTSNIYTDQGSVLCALSIPFEQVNGRYLDEIKNNGGLDGIVTFADGDLVIFAKQQFLYSINKNNEIITVDDYNYGWSDIINTWDHNPWAYNTNVSDSDTSTNDLTPGEAWNKSSYVAGYKEYIDLAVTNQRAGIWKINIIDNFVTLSFHKEIKYYDKVEILDGSTYSNTILYFDPIIQPNREVPEYSIIPKLSTVKRTTFDGNGTKFLSNRDLPTTPGLGDKYIKFAKIGVFT